MGRSRSRNQQRKRRRDHQRKRGHLPHSRETHPRGQMRVPAHWVRASGVLAVACAGLCALFTLGVLATLPGTAERERAYRTPCAAGDSPDTCTTPVQATVTAYEHTAGPRPNIFVALSGPPPAHGRFELRSGTVDWPGMKTGQAVTANVWRDEVTTVTYRGSTASVHADSPGGDTALRISLALAGVIGTAWAVQAARRHLRRPTPDAFERWPGRVRTGSALIAWSIGVGWCFDIGEANVGWVPPVWGAGALLFGIWTQRVTPDPDEPSRYGQLAARIAHKATRRLTPPQPRG